MRKRKKLNSVALIQSTDPIMSELALEKLAEMVAHRLQAQASSKSPAEMTADELTDTVLLQPWFLPREVSNAILRLLPVSHQDKWLYTFEDWGCWRCESKEVKIHQSLGLCSKCYALVSNRLKSSIVRRAIARPNVADLVSAMTKKADTARLVLAEHEIVSSKPKSRNAAL